MAMFDHANSLEDIVLGFRTQEVAAAVFDAMKAKVPRSYKIGRDRETVSLQAKHENLEELQGLVEVTLPSAAEGSEEDQNQKLKATIKSLRLAFRFGRVKDSDLADLASLQLAEWSMEMFRAYEPRAISRFLARLARGPPELDPQSVMKALFAKYVKFLPKEEAPEARSLDLGEAYSIAVFLASLLHAEPLVGVDLLDACTGVPYVENEGMHPLPVVLSLKSPLWGGSWPRLYSLLNARDKTLSMLRQDRCWTYDSQERVMRKWHKDLADEHSHDPPRVDVKVEVCFIPGLMSAEIFFALGNSGDATIFQHRVVSSLVQRGWWQAAYRHDMLRLFLTCWFISVVVVLNLAGSSWNLGAWLKETVAPFIPQSE
jgi:hypothetical protein